MLSPDPRVPDAGPAADLEVATGVSHLALPTTTGLPPRLAACLAYSGWWLSGALLLAAEPRHPFVRFHARQALIGFGLLWLLGMALWAASFAAAFLSPGAFTAASVANYAVWTVGLLAWVVCLVVAARGGEWSLPWMRWLDRRTSRHA